ncbi:carboxymuconolactone decarboxylase family protein [Intrasporangium mesophilum]
MPLKTKHPRVAPVEPPYDAETAEALGMLGPPIQLFRVFARRPDLARSVAGWGRYYLSRRSALTLRHRELVIDRTTALCGAGYEWGVHIAQFAGKAELSDSQLESLATGKPTDACWPAGDRPVLTAVDTLHEMSDLDDETWTNLVDSVGQDGALELLLLTGWYHAISFAVNALHLPLEPGTKGLD